MKDFEELCKKLDDLKKGGAVIYKNENEYLYAYNAVKEYVGDDMNELYKLKVECQMNDWWQVTSTLLAEYAVGTSLLAFIYCVFLECIKGDDNFGARSGIGLAIGLLLLLWWIIKIIQKHLPSERWQKYIQVAIENIEKEQKKEEVTVDRVPVAHPQKKETCVRRGNHGKKKSK